jgi:hypothetical protein
MRTKVACLAGAALLLIGGLAAPSSANAATLTKGTYNVSAYISAFTPLNGVTNFCFPNAENHFGLVTSFTITYNGPGKAAVATIPVPFTPAIGANPLAGPFVDLLALPPTPTGGNTSWNGMYTETLQPGGFVFEASSFTATLVVTSSLSFVGTMTLANFSSGGDLNQDVANICNVTLQYSAVFVGPTH